MKADKNTLAARLGNNSRIYADRTSLMLYACDQGEIAPSLKALFMRDSAPDLALQPGVLHDLQVAIRYAGERSIPLVPRGASTSGMGGAIAHQGGILLDFSTRREIYDFDAEAGLIRTGAGCRWSDVSRYLNSRGFELRTYPTSWFSTIAGWASTGGIGIGCTQYGSFHSAITAMTVVTPAGEISRMRREDGELQNYLGTEGQMGAIWDLTFMVRKKPAIQIPILLQCTSIAQAMNLAKEILKQFNPYHLKFLHSNRIHEINHLLREEHHNLKQEVLIPEKETLLICFESSDEAGRFTRWAEHAGLNLIKNFQSHLLWRERMFPLRVKRIAPGLLASELIMPLDNAARYAEAAIRLGRKFNVSIAVEAYFLPDQTVLMLPVYTFSSTGFIDEGLKSALVYALTIAGIKLGGRPYGTGIWNTPFVRDRFGAEFSALHSFKRNTDPAQLFNPGKFFKLHFRNGFRSSIASQPLKRSLIPVWAAAATAFAPFFTSLSGKISRSADPVLLNEELCSRCGSCVAVCPAYIETGDERTTARGKLLLGRLIAEGGEVTKDEAGMLSLCMHCGACSDVCQSRLDLVPVWDLLEERVQQKYGRNQEQIETFVRSVEKKKIMEVPYARGAKIVAGS